MRQRYIAILGLCSLGCTVSTQLEDGPPTLRIAGSNTIVEQLLPPLTQTHVNTRKTIRFSLQADGNSNGIRQLLKREVDLAATTREYTSAEEDQANAFGFSLEGNAHIIAVDVVAISVHPSNPLEALTYDQVIGIFCTQEIDNWSFLGLEEQPLRLVTRRADSGTRILFEDFFCGPRGIHRSAEVKTRNEIAEILSSDPTAISFVSMAESSGKVLGLRPEAQAKAVVPSKRNLIRGAYPLAQDLILYSPGNPSPAAREFIDWIGSPAGQDVVDEAHFVPLFLRPTVLDEPRPLRETIHFKTHSSTPTPRSIARIGLLIEELKARIGEYNHIVLEGYTDSQEDDAVSLSRARAEGVRDILAEVLPGRFFEIIPRGAINPIAPNETPYGRQRNRRVQIYLAGDEKSVVANEVDESSEPEQD